MKLKVGGVPTGTYTGEFVGLETVEAKPDQKYGPGLCWAWAIVGGPFDGQKATRITGDRPSAKSAAGKMLRAVTGIDPKPGVEIDLDPFVGKRYHLLVEDAPSGNGTRVASAVPVEA